MSAAILLAEATLLPSGVDLSLFSILVKSVGKREVLVQVRNRVLHVDTKNISLPCSVIGNFCYLLWAWALAFCSAVHCANSDSFGSLFTMGTVSYLNICRLIQANIVTRWLSIISHAILLVGCHLCSIKYLSSFLNECNAPILSSGCKFIW
jgi:hypothetical protein